MKYPLVHELAADGIPVTVRCRVLKLARQPYYRWLQNPVTEADLEAAHRANALHDAHQNDPEFGYRLLRDEAEAAEGVRCPAAEGVREGTALPRLVVLALADAWRKVVAEPETAWWK